MEFVNLLGSLSRRLYSFEFVLFLACAGFFYKAAEFEDESAFLWTVLSVSIFIVTWIVFSWGWLGCLFGQLGLFVGIAVVRVLRKQ